MISPPICLCGIVGVTESELTRLTHGRQKGSYS